MIKSKVKTLTTILGIDTSCDDTSVAIVQDNRVVANIISSQFELHKKYGGVVPMIAKRAHEERIDFVIQEALARASLNCKLLTPLLKINATEYLSILLYFNNRKTGFSEAAILKFTTESLGK